MATKNYRANSSGPEVPDMNYVEGIALYVDEKDFCKN